jgi:hypothetical protein
VRWWLETTNDNSGRPETQDFLIMKRDTREMLELVGIVVAAVMITPIAIFMLVILLSL